MSSVNRVILLGHLGQRPDIRQFPDGNSVANLSVATSRRWKSATTGERQEKTEWHRVVVHDQAAVKFASEYLDKGDRVYIEGAQETREYQKDGVTHRITETVVRPFRGLLQSIPKPKGTDD